MATTKRISLSRAKVTEVVVWWIDAPFGYESKGDLEVRVKTSSKRRDDPSGEGYMETMDAAIAAAEKFYGVDSRQVTIPICDNT